MATSHDVEVIRLAESLHTRFNTVLCLFIGAGLFHLFFTQGIGPRMLILGLQVVLGVATFCRYQSWCRFRNRDDVVLAYQRHQELMESLDRKAR